MADEQVVLLGTVKESHPVDDSSPYACKGGGSPAWYAEQPREASTLVCPKCKTSLFLVAQVYAPVESDRTLYVFGCNSPSCTSTPGSWRVLRDQATVSSAPKAVAPEPVQVVAPASSGWAGGDDKFSDWSDDEDDDDFGGAKRASNQAVSSNLSDLELLLKQRDDALTTSAPTPSQTRSAQQETRSDAANTTSGPSTNTFPAVHIEVIDEPFEDYTSENDYSYEDRLLKNYMKQEEEEKSADLEDLRRILSAAKKGGTAAAGTGGGGNSSESYEKTPAQQQHFMRFQKRINRCPLQCLRYNYGGEPLWPVPPPRNLKIPRCPCGDERSFELQLTPTLNYFLKVDDFAVQPAASAASGNATSTTPKVIQGGMDWLSVIVYSCASSCSLSKEEYVHIVPSSDTM
ncbi:TPA: hypothetical protein N0F65_008178 [Lagenidium giganteum]|uniref:Programmed cell death protein 2 C-terminal domain-containing protein n=1 Tax=Lagenidium giganteum TaxID=4803 RepID=A0AAV2YI65_9STRA|nr:TPA: hypothetical protein N0F65_008178 [Lagenidium giganteum]